MSGYSAAIIVMVIAIVGVVYIVMRDIDELAADPVADIPIPDNEPILQHIDANEAAVEELADELSESAAEPVPVTETEAEPHQDPVTTTDDENEVHVPVAKEISEDIPQTALEPATDVENVTKADHNPVMTPDHDEKG